MEPLAHTTNNFGGIILDPAALPASSDEFRTRLLVDMEKWMADEFKLVWLEAPLTHAELMPVAVQMGFFPHHATEEYVMLVKRLQANAFIPPYATHYIGIGGVVLNEKQELLVVVEKYHKMSRPNFYKLPGGALQAGEHLADAAIREVYEETGVETKFDGLVCLRHWHGYRYGKSDIYFVARLVPISQEIKQDHEEIAECRWMPVEEYLGHQTVHAFNKTIVRAALQSQGLQTTWIEGYDDPKAREFFMPVEIAGEHRR
jgi:8-oxo-dGTP pyrophosphatase MutT (NUDIX family)